MTLRFQKRITLIPGVRLNFGKKGVSVSLGPRGSSINFGSKGIYANLSIPGTGLSMRRRLDNGRKRPNTVNESHYLHIMLKLDDNGLLSFETKTGSPLSTKIINQIKKEHREYIEELLQKEANKINTDCDELMVIHHLTPPPTQNKLAYHQLDIPFPKKPILTKVKFYHRIFGWDSEITRANNEKISLYEKAINYWETIKKDHAEATELFNLIVQQSNNGDLKAMEQILEYILSDLHWAKDTQVNFNFQDHNTLHLDIDLPNLKDMPKKTAEVASRGFKLLIKYRNQVQLKKDFNHFIHAVFFRISGETFSNFPTLQKIILSGYIQRNNLLTGVDEDMYIVSVEIDKQKWCDIDFSKLNDLDPINALERFNIRKKIDRSYNFCPINPL